MDDMQQKLNAILSNPDMMQQLMGMAQSLGQSQGSPQPPQQPQQPAAETLDVGGFGLQNLDLGAIQKIAGLAQKAGIDRNQQSLLKALSPYLTSQHITKLEKAMRAAKLAGIAGTFLGSNSQFLSGR